MNLIWVCNLGLKIDYTSCGKTIKKIYKYTVVIRRAEYIKFQKMVWFPHFCGTNSC